MRPTRIETYGDARTAEVRLRQIGASFSKEHSDGSRAVYYVGRTKSWATAVKSGGQYVVSYYAACPCG